MSIALILAAGKAERHNGGNKPLLKVGNETLLERMVRQIKPHVETIWLITHREDLTHQDCKLFNPPSHDFICDTLHSSSLIWCLGSRTIVLLGDVYYTDNSMAFIVKYDSDVAAFGDGCNIHALSIPYQHAFWTSGQLGLFRKCVHAEPFKHKHGKLYAFCDWLSPRIKRIALDTDTTDIDSPLEHKRLLAKLKL